MKATIESLFYSIMHHLRGNVMHKVVYACFIAGCLVSGVSLLFICAGHPHPYFYASDGFDPGLQAVRLLSASAAFILFAIAGKTWNTTGRLMRDMQRKTELLALSETKNEKLSKTNTELDKFVYSVSHDLRAPLKSMTGIIEITGQESEDPFVKEHMDLLQESISKLDRFIVDMLEYSRNAKSEIRKEKIDFQELLNDITRNLKYMCENQRPVEISLDVQSESPFCSDKGKLSTVLNNLISNSIRYHNPESKDPFVRVKVKTTDKQVEIMVKDNGIGISKDLHDKIFEMFYRVTENSVGSGLGLYLVKETVEKLNGEIKVDSHPGVGTEFSLQIPNLFFQ